MKMEESLETFHFSKEERDDQGDNDCLIFQQKLWPSTCNYFMKPNIPVYKRQKNIKK